MTLYGTQSRTVLSRPIGDFSGGSGLMRSLVLPEAKAAAFNCATVGLYNCTRQTMAPVAGSRTASMPRNIRSTLIMFSTLDRRLVWPDEKLPDRSQSNGNA